VTDKFQGQIATIDDLEIREIVILLYQGIYDLIILEHHLSTSASKLREGYDMESEESNFVSFRFWLVLHEARRIVLGRREKEAESRSKRQLAFEAHCEELTHGRTGIIAILPEYKWLVKKGLTEEQPEGVVELLRQLYREEEHRFLASAEAKLQETDGRDYLQMLVRVYLHFVDPLHRQGWIDQAIEKAAIEDVSAFNQELIWEIIEHRKNDLCRLREFIESLQGERELIIPKLVNTLMNSRAYGRQERELELNLVAVRDEQIADTARLALRSCFMRGDDIEDLAAEEMCGHGEPSRLELQGISLKFLRDYVPGPRICEFGLGHAIGETAQLWYSLRSAGLTSGFQMLGLEMWAFVNNPRPTDSEAAAKSLFFEEFLFDGNTRIMGPRDLVPVVVKMAHEPSLKPVLLKVRESEKAQTGTDED
jgi:hypothetical protein